MGWKLLEGWDVRLRGCVAGNAGDGRGDGRGLRCSGFHQCFSVFRGWGRVRAGLAVAGASVMALHVTEVAVVTCLSLAPGSRIHTHGGSVVATADCTHWCVSTAFGSMAKLLARVAQLSSLRCETSCLSWGRQTG